MTTNQTEARELPKFNGRAYQVQYTEKVLPDLLPLPFGVVSIDAADLYDAESLYEYYQMAKAQVALIEDCFGSAEEMEEADAVDKSWVFTSDNPGAVADFADLMQDEPVAVDEYLFDYFYEAAAEEFGRSPRRYSRFNLDDVVLAECLQYKLMPAGDGNGANFVRQPGGSVGEVRSGASLNVVTLDETDPSGSQERSPWQALEEADSTDGSDY